MSSLSWVVLMLVYYIESVFALSLNFCIAFVNGRSLRNRTKQNLSAVIQISMAAINIITRTLMFTEFSVLMFPSFRFDGLYQIMLVLLPFQMYISNWLISWLCAYYCISIANFTSRVFIWVRRILSSGIPHLLVISAVGSMALSLAVLWSVRMNLVYYTDNTLHLNTTYITLVPLGPTHLIICIFLGLCLPFIISSFALLTTVGSLLRHIWNMKQQESGFSPSRVRVHVNAIRTMILLLLLSLIFCISEMTVYNVSSITNPAVVTCWIVINLFPTLEAAIIFQSSSRLSKMVLGRLCMQRAMESGA